MEGKNNVLVTSGVFYGKEIKAAVFYDNKENPDTLEIIRKDEESSVGEIVTAKVQNIVKQINAAFLDLGNGRRAFLPLVPRMQILYTHKYSKGSELHQGDEIAVQIIRDPLKTKDAAASHVLTFHGAYCMMEINGKGISASKKLSKKKRDELKNFVSDIASEGMMFDRFEFSLGIMIRTAAADASLKEIEEDVSRVYSSVCEFTDNIFIQQPFLTLRPPFDPVIEKILRIPSASLGEIVTDDPTLIGKFQTEAKTSMQAEYCLSKIRFYEDDTYPLWKLRGMDRLLKEITQKNVWLKSGAYLVVEATEALHVIDVNSGKFNMKKSSAETMMQINKEAAKEIARQLRLRNLSGMILIDFINLRTEDEYKELMSFMKKAVKDDPSAVAVVDYTKLGLMELTRKKTGPSIREKLLDGQ